MLRASRKGIGMAVGALGLALAGATGQACAADSEVTKVPATVAPLESLVISKSLTDFEFNVWVDELAKRSPITKTIREYLPLIRNQVEEVSGKLPSVNYVLHIAPDSYVDLSNPATDTTNEIGGSFSYVDNELNVRIVSNPFVRFLKLASDESLNSFPSIFGEAHEWQHALAYAYSPINALHIFLAERGLGTTVNFDGNGNRIYVIFNNENLPDDDDRVNIFNLGGPGLYWLFNNVDEEQAVNVLSEYMNDLLPPETRSYENAAADIVAKLGSFDDTSRAFSLISEVQAYFAFPKGPIVSEDGSDIERIVSRYIPSEQSTHNEFIRMTINNVAEAYTILDMAGITGFEADDRVAQLVGQSMIGTEFSPYVFFEEGVDSLRTSLGIEKPTMGDIEQTFANRKAKYSTLRNNAHNSVLEYIGETIVTPEFQARFPGVTEEVTISSPTVTVGDGVHIIAAHVTVN
jgi:hypothetical protein